MNTHFFIDVHCHPSIKAFARSFAILPGDQPAGTRSPASVWHRDAPSLFDKIKNFGFGLTNFIQSDATSLVKGRVSVSCLSFYPQEKGFFINKAGTGIISDTLTKLASEFGQQRIDFLQSHTSYWEDLRAEMRFLRQREGTVVQTEGRRITYRIARSFADIAEAEQLGQLGESVILFVPSIEGAHVFDQVMDCYEPWNKFPGGVPAERLQPALERARQLRAGADGMLRPAFITFAHHFWNGLCGHARSLEGFVKCIVDQENGIEIGFTDAGRAMLHVLLDEMRDADGHLIPPIHIDIKHMSRRARLEYFKILEEEFPGRNIPVMVSHGGVTGQVRPGVGSNTSAAQEGLFYHEAINFFDDELLKIDETNGIFGIQLDERRIGSKQALRNARGNIARRKILYNWARLVWNQVRHIAEVLDGAGRYAWGIQSLGTDFDGIIDPINGYWTSAEMDELDDYLLKHAHNYLTGKNQPCPLTQARNRNISAEEIIERMMTSNALDYLARIY